MTERQQKVFSMYNMGMSVQEIAKTLKISYAAVRAVLVHNGGTCIYSNSCFTCPLPDCVVSDLYVNSLSGGQGTSV